jgi:hypothetical protein
MCNLGAHSIPSAMTTVLNATKIPEAAPAPDSVRTPEQAQAHIQHKAQKKQRKLERLLFFFGWCEGCRSYGNSV